MSRPGNWGALDEMCTGPCCRDENADDYLPAQEVLDGVLLERQRQDSKWGEQNHDPFVWLAVLGKEVGEANQAALKATFGNKPWKQYREELVHVAAVAVAAIECLDRHGSAPPVYATDPNARPDIGATREG